MTTDFKSIRQALLDMSSIVLLDILPAGSIVGGHWQCGDLHGGKGNSFKLNLSTGVWRDFANPAHSGSDIIALYAMQKNINMLEAAKQLKEKYLGGEVAKYNYPVKPKKETQEIIKPPATAAKPKIPTNCQYWEYRDISGDLCFYIVKGINESGKKYFYPLSFTNKNEWIKKGWDELKPLYNVQNLSTKPVMIVEGEKCADVCIKFFQQYDVVTWAGGAAAWKHTDWSPLQDKKVLIWPDADEAGTVLATQLGHYLRDTCSQIKIIHTNKSDGWDAYDAIVHESWDFSKWAQWAKPLLTVWDRPVQIQVLEPEEKAPEPVAISTDEFPIQPNMTFLFDKLDLQTGDKGAVIMNASNVAKILKSQMPNLVWRDTFYNANMTKWQTGEDRIWSDEDTNNLFIKMQIHYGLAKLTKNHVEDAINFVAAQDRRNEPQDWLNSLKWDGISRVDSFLNVALRSEDNDWSRICSKNFWISLVARVLNAGCQVDEMLVLESPQGFRKTSALIIIGGKWYGEVNADLKDKDFDQGLVGKIIVEFGELSAMKNSDIELVKKKITCRVDQYRPSYGRRTEKFPRTCIFAGTTNEKNYLKDSTGGRRFNPMKVGNADIEYIKENREQLFAEAVSRYKAGESWWDYPTEVAGKVRESRREADEWEALIESKLTQPPLNTMFISTMDIWLNALNGSPEKLDKTIQIRIGKVMRKLGYENKVSNIGGAIGRIWSRS